MNIRLVLFIFIIITIDSSFAQSKQEFCKTIIESNSTRKTKVSKKKMSIGLLYRVLFAPKQIVRVVEVKTSEESAFKVLGKTRRQAVAFINLEEVNFNQVNKKHLKNLNKKVRQIRRLAKKSGLKKRLQSVSNMNNCLDSVTLFELGYNFSFHSFSKLLAKRKKLISRKRKYQAYKIATQKLKFLKRMGIKAYVNKNYTEVFKILNRGAFQTVLFVGHSNEFGDLYLGERTKERVPINFFDALNSLPRNLIFYTCNARAVIEKYALKSLESSIFFSFVSEKDESIFGETVPFIAIRSLESPLRDIQRSSLGVIRKEFKCSFTGNVAYTVDYLLYINNYFVGSLDTKNENMNFAFPCKYLDRKINKIKLLPRKGEYLRSIDIFSSFRFFSKDAVYDDLQWRGFELENNLLQITALIK